MISRLHYYILILLLNLHYIGFSQHITPKEYIEKYKDIAIKEMKRTGIPASITLAQGMLESDNGNSRLARKANNHFGIKCHDDWKGPKIKHNDDKRKECFRKYGSAKESYKDHSDFLVNGSRYDFLFKYSSTDYISWAEGLQKAGYATYKKYAKKLIEIIEKYELYEYDTGKKTDKKKERKKDKQKKGVTAYQTTPTVNRDVYINNGTSYVIVQEGDTYRSIAEEFGTIENMLFKFNDLPKNATITVGQKIYVKPKRNKAEKGYDYHYVKEGETMYTISQKYAIKLKNLYELNELKPGTKLSDGQKLKLR